MAEITVDIEIKGQVKTVVISQPAGLPVTTYDLTIDNYFCGRIWETEQFGWQHDINPKWGISREDIAMMIEGLMNL